MAWKQDCARTKRRRIEFCYISCLRLRYMMSEKMLSSYILCISFDLNLAKKLFDCLSVSFLISETGGVIFSR